MIKRRVYLAIVIDQFNRYIIDGDPRDEHITLSRQKRNSVDHGWTVLSAMSIPAVGINQAIDVAEALIDAANIIGVLKEDNQEWLDTFASTNYTMSNTVRHSSVQLVKVSFVEFE